MGPPCGERWTFKGVALEPSVLEMHVMNLGRIDIHIAFTVDDDGVRVPAIPKQFAQVDEFIRSTSSSARS
jgi:hypothetical protein